MNGYGFIKEEKLLVRSDNSRINNYDVMRLGLALMVIISHASSVLKGIGAAEPLSGALHGTTLGSVAVDGFFAISGFLVTGSWCNTSPTKYFKKRVGRIFPGFFVACGITVLLACITSRDVIFSIRTTRWWEVFLSTITVRRPAVSLAFSGNPYPLETNASLWTLKFEVGCYIVTAALGSIGYLKGRMRDIIVTLYAVSVVASVIIGPGGEHGGLSASALRMLTFYLAGAATYCFRTVVPRSTALTIACIAAVLLAPLAGWLVSVTLPTAGVYLLFRAIYSDWRVAPDLAGKSGDMSYGLYLYGWPVEQTIVSVMGTKMLNAWSLAFFAIAICLPVAWMSWWCVERPCISLTSHSRIHGKARTNLINQDRQMGF